MQNVELKHYNNVYEENFYFLVSPKSRNHKMTHIVRDKTILNERVSILSKYKANDAARRANDATWKATKKAVATRRYGKCLERKFQFNSMETLNSHFPRRWLR